MQHASAVGVLADALTRGVERSRLRSIAVEHGLPSFSFGRRREGCSFGYELELRPSAGGAMLRRYLEPIDAPATWALSAHS